MTLISGFFSPTTVQQKALQHRDPRPIYLILGGASTNFKSTEQCEKASCGPSTNGVKIVILLILVYELCQF